MNEMPSEHWHPEKQYKPDEQYRDDRIHDRDVAGRLGIIHEGRLLTTTFPKEALDTIHKVLDTFFAQVRNSQQVRQYPIAIKLEERVEHQYEIQVKREQDICEKIVSSNVIDYIDRYKEKHLKIDATKVDYDTLATGQMPDVGHVCIEYQHIQVHADANSSWREVVVTTSGGMTELMKERG